MASKRSRTGREDEQELGRLNCSGTDASRLNIQSPRSRALRSEYPLPSLLFLFAMSAPLDLEFTDLSDLTELSSDDESRSSITKSSKGKQPAKDSFVLKNTLRPPRSVSYTTKWLHGAVDCWPSRDSLNTVPPYRPIDTAAHRPRPGISGSLPGNQQAFSLHIFSSVMSFGRRRNKWA